jgi:hypothetical protein
MDLYLPRWTLYPLYAIDAEIPKLDVAGSNPVSRSIFSTTYECLLHSQGLLNALIAVTVHSKSMKLRQVHSVNASMHSAGILEV